VSYSKIQRYMILTLNSLEELKSYEQERRELEPEAKSPVVELQELEEELEKDDTKMETDQEDNDITMEDVDEDEDIKPARSLRRANDRAADRARRQEEERKRKEKAEKDKANKPTKEAKALDKLLKKIETAKDNIKECEAEIAICDGDLRESDCHRTRLLGKDRFWNRYWWYERNAMPFGGLPDSSTADAGYANGCIWVQGPDDMERAGFIDLPDEDQARYHSAFKMTVPDRKIKEEGDTHTFTAFQWGYYDDPEDLDRLMGWLNVKGEREIHLRKELGKWREQIMILMGNRKRYLEQDRAKRSESPAPRISSRTKAAAAAAPSARRCSKWTNDTARAENGHLHIEPQPPKRAAAKKGRSSLKDEGRQTRAGNKPSKGPSRQGTRYSF
jgi:hypothetical protein